MNVLKMSTKQNHKRWRKAFNEVCLNRDSHTCFFCNVTEELDVHHITDRKEIFNGGYVLSNGITLCPEHHLLCEQYHMTGECQPEYHPNTLYKLINSSYEQACEDSKNLT